MPHLQKQTLLLCLCLWLYFAEQVKKVLGGVTQGVLLWFLCYCGNILTKSNLGRRGLLCLQVQSSIQGSQSRNLKQKAQGKAIY